MSLIFAHQTESVRRISESLSCHMCSTALDKSANSCPLTSNTDLNRFFAVRLHAVYNVQQYYRTIDFESLQIGMLAHFGDRNDQVVSAALFPQDRTMFASRYRININFVTAP